MKHSQYGMVLYGDVQHTVFVQLLDLCSISEEVDGSLDFECHSMT